MAIRSPCARARIKMHTIVWIAVLVTTVHAQTLISCVEYCNLNPEQSSLFLRHDCMCSEHHRNILRNNKPKFKRPASENSAIYYEPSDEYPYYKNVDYPFYIINPTYHGQTYRKGENRRVRTAGTRNPDHIEEHNHTPKNTKLKDSEIRTIDIEAEYLPLYLDIDIYKSIRNDRSAIEMQQKNGITEEDLMECINLHILVYSRKEENNADADLKDIWDDSKISKYEGLSDSDLKIEIQSKCHQPSEIVQKSLHEIKSSWPRKAQLKSEQKSEHTMKTILLNRDGVTQSTEEPNEINFSTPTTDDNNREFSQSTSGVNWNIDHTTVKNMASKYYMESTERNDLINNVDQEHFQLKNTLSTLTDKSVSTTSARSTNRIETNNSVKIPKIITKEFVNDTVFSNLNGTETIFYKDFVEQYVTDNNIVRNLSEETTTLNDLFETTISSFKELSRISDNGELSLKPSENYKTAPYDDAGLSFVNDDYTSPVTNIYYNEKDTQIVPEITTEDSTTNRVTQTERTNYPIPKDAEFGVHSDNVLHSTESDTKTSIEKPDPTASMINIETTLSKMDYTATDSDLLNPILELNQTTSTPGQDLKSPYSSVTNDRARSEVTQIEYPYDHESRSKTEESVISRKPDMIVNLTYKYEMTTQIVSYNSDVNSTETYIDLTAENTKLSNKSMFDETPITTTEQNLISTTNLDINEIQSTDMYLATEPFSHIIRNESFESSTEFSNDRYLGTVTPTSPKSEILGNESNQSIPILSNPEDIFSRRHDLLTTLQQSRTTENVEEVTRQNSTQTLDFEMMPNEMENTTYSVSLDSSETYDDFKSNKTKFIQNTTPSQLKYTTDQIRHSEPSYTSTIMNNVDDATEKAITTSSDVTGKLYFVFGERQVPVHFVQNSDGEIKLGLDGQTLCEKIIANNSKDSLIIKALCNYAVPKNCTNIK